MSGWDWVVVELLEFAGRIKHVSFLRERLESGRFRVWAEGETKGLRVRSLLGEHPLSL